MAESDVEKYGIMAAIAAGVVWAADRLRPKQARMFAVGPLGETETMWDPKSIPAKK